MKRNWLMVAVIMLALAGGTAAQAAGDQAQQSYTGPEYAAFNAAVSEKDATQRVKLLDDFVAKYPKSTLLPYAYQSYYLAYSELRNYLQVMTYCDKLLALGDAVDAIQGLGMARLQALELRARVFFLALGQRQLTTNEQFSTARDAASQGLKFIDERKKPEGLTDDQFKQQNNAVKSLFYSVGGYASRQLKDYKAAIDFFRGALAITPNDPALYYQIGLSSLQQDPPQHQDGFWAIARAVALKVQGEAQVRNYLKNQLARYQQPVCDSLLDAQLNELIALAASAAERPASFTIHSRDELNKKMESLTVDGILSDLKAGGDNAKVVWLAACGAEFPELLGKVFEVTDAGDAVTLKVFTAGTQDVTEAGTAPNIEVRIEGQPAAKRLKKDEIIVYSAALKTYTPDPFVLQLEKGKVREDTLPPEAKAPPKKAAPAKKAPPKKAPAKAPTKAPAQRPPSKGAGL